VYFVKSLYIATIKQGNFATPKKPTFKMSKIITKSKSSNAQQVATLLLDIIYVGGFVAFFSFVVITIINN